MLLVPEAVTDKVHSYPTPKNVKEVQDFVEILGFWTTCILHLVQCLHPLYCPIKKGHVWAWRAEQQLWEDKSTSQADESSGHLPTRATITVSCVYDSGRYGSGTVADTTEGESDLGILVPVPEGNRKLIYNHRLVAPSNIHSTPPGRATHKGTTFHGENFPSYQGVGWKSVPMAYLCHGSNLHFD